MKPTALPTPPATAVLQTPSDSAQIRNRIYRLEPAAQQSLATAEKLIADLAAAKKGEKPVKAVARKIVGAANQVIAVVEGVAELNSVAKAVVTVFKALIKLELDRESNNEQIAVVCYAMTSLMYVLRNMTTIFEANDDWTELLDSQFGKIADTMTGFGNFAAVYYQHKQSIFRVLKSGSYKEELDAYVDDFNEYKRELFETFSARSTVTVQATQQQLTIVNTNINRIINMLGSTNQKERKAQQLIEERGGPHEVIFNDAVLAEVAKTLGEKLTTPVKNSLREELGSLLQDNRVAFDLKIEGATTQITEAVERSQEAILRRLDAGPHDEIEDPDLQTVWKHNQWRASVKCRVFVDALHDYFDTKFRHFASKNGHNDPDAWTLQALSKVKYHSSIADVIDEDGSGFISCHEVNHFLKARPDGWTVPQWFAFWAIAWSESNLDYCEKLKDLFEKIRSASTKARRVNREFLVGYLEVLNFLKPMILDCLGADYGDNTAFDDIEAEDELELHRLQVEYNTLREHAISDVLKKTEYWLEDKSSMIAAISGPNAPEGQDRIELSLLPLLCVILEHHFDVVAKTRKEVVPEEKFDDMTETLLTVFEAFTRRMQDLIYGWKQQKADVNIHIQSFASGLYVGWHRESQVPEGAFNQLRKLLESDDDDEEEEEEEEEDGDAYDDSLISEGDDKEEPSTVEAEPDKLDQMSSRIETVDNRLANIENLLRSLLDAQGPAHSAPAHDRSPSQASVGSAQSSSSALRNSGPRRRVQGNHAQIDHEYSDAYGDPGQRRGWRDEPPSPITRGGRSSEEEEGGGEPDEEDAEDDENAEDDEDDEE